MLKNGTRLAVDALTPEIDSPAPGWKLRGAHASGKLNRKDFGVSWEGPSNSRTIVADEINIELDVELKRQAAADQADGGAPPKGSSSAAGAVPPAVTAAPKK